MVAYVAAIDFRTNITAKVNIVPLIQEPREGIVHRINWMNWNMNSEGGSTQVADIMFMVEGPLPPGAATEQLDNNIVRDDGAFKALVVFHPTGSTSTADPATAQVVAGIANFPGGIWSVERIFVGYRTAGGVDNARFALGYEKVAVSKVEWERLVNHSPNSKQAGLLIQ